MVSKWVITYLQMGYIGVITHLLTNHIQTGPNMLPLCSPILGSNANTALRRDSPPLRDTWLTRTGRFGRKCAGKVEAMMLLRSIRYMNLMFESKITWNIWMFRCLVLETQLYSYFCFITHEVPSCVCHLIYGNLNVNHLPSLDRVLRRLRFKVIILVG